MLYLLQLVQAIRYENLELVKSSMVEQAVTAGVTQDVLDEALADEEASPDPDESSTDDITASQIPEYDDPTDIRSDLESSVQRDAPQPGEVCHHTSTTQSIHNIDKHSIPNTADTLCAIKNMFNLSQLVITVSSFLMNRQ